MRVVGNFSRATMAQQQNQALPSASQHRSTSVLASLLRMRNQFQRLRAAQQQQVIATTLARSSKKRLLGTKDASLTSASNTAESHAVAAANGDDDANINASSCSSSSLQAGVLLCTEAQRLLKGETRANDLLSDVATSSSTYAAEAGKLLTAAAAFGAATTYPRVQEVCAWIRANTSALHTPRQIMSLCTPLTNLTDGATAGVFFVLEVLYEPLLLALQEAYSSQGRDEGETHATSTSGPPAAAAYSEDTTASGASVEQQLVAINSAFTMVAKWSTAFMTRAASVTKEEDAPYAALEEEREKMQRIAEASVVALARHTRVRNGEDGGRSPDVIHAALQQLSVSDVALWLQCLHGVERTISVVATEEAKGEAMRRLTLCYRVLLTPMRQIMEMQERSAAAPGGGGGEGGVAVNKGSAIAASATGFRVQDAADLVQIGLFLSVESQHTDLALRYGLQALPHTLGSVTVREACLVTQVVNKVRVQRPAALPAALVRSVMASLRPRLFLLRESQAYQLRPQDCSLLLSQLSRWEEVPGVAVSADVVELLSQRFGEQMPTVEATHLIPFVQALARLEERHRRAEQRDAKAATKLSGAEGEEGESAAGGENASGEHGGVEAPSFIAARAAAAADSSSAVVSSSSSSAASARHRRHRHRRAKAVRYFYSTTARAVAQCAQRAAMLAADENPGGHGSSDGGGEAVSAPRLSAAEAAQLITAFVQLSAPQVEFVFAAVEPLLSKCLTKESSSMQGFSSCTSSSSSLPSSAPVELYTRVTVQDAVVRFTAFMADAHAGETHTGPTAQRARALLTKMEHTLTSVVLHAERPKDLVMVSPLVRHRLLLDHHHQHHRCLARSEAHDADEDAGLHRVHRSNGDAKPATAVAVAWRRVDVRLATRFAQQVSRVAAVCNGFELGALATAVSSLTAAGVLPPTSAARQAALSLWSRCADGLAATPPAKTATPLTLTLDDCKKLMDALRTTLLALTPSDQRAMPPTVFLEAFAALCTELFTGMSAEDASTADGVGDCVRGTSQSYAKALADLHRYTALGRSVLSCFAACSSAPSASAAAAVPQQEQRQRKAWHLVVEAYLEVAHAAMESYATEAALSESWWADASEDGSRGNAADNTEEDSSQLPRQPPPVPLELLSMTAHVVTQLQQLVHRRHDFTKQKAGAMAATTVEEEVDGLSEPGAVLVGQTSANPTVLTDEGVGPEGEEEEADEDFSDALPSPAQTSLATIDAAVSGVLGALGDTIAILARQQQQQQQQTQLDAGVSACADNDAELIADAGSTERPVTTVNPKHLLMLLHAFEMARYRHPEMLYGILPELRSCASQLDPLELSLLIRALTQLGAWNSRLLQVLATAVETKMQTCELRQCHTLLHGLCRSGCVSPDTFVELRGTAYTEWTRAGTRRGDTPQEPLQRLAESVLGRLDALVRTQDAFFHLSRTAAVADVVKVVTALRFFHVPPPATYDAFVVLAVYKLVRAHRCKSVAPGTVLQHAIVVLDAVSLLRQPAQQRVSAEALWTVVHRVASLGDNSGVASLPVCWQLWRLACQHSLQYGKDVTHVLFDAPSPPSAALFSRVQERLGKLVEAYAWGPDPSRGPNGAADGGARGVPVLSPSDQIALRRYASHAAPSLARNDRELAEHLCFPLRLARLITEQQCDLSVLVNAPLFTAPAAQAKRYVQLAACLLRADLWDGNLIDAEAQLMLITAFQQLWDHSDLHDLLQTSPEVFTTEEVVVLAAAAAHLQQVAAASTGGVEAGVYHDDCAAALRQLRSDKTIWRLATAVDAWSLFTRFAAPPAEPQLRFPDLRCTADVFAVLARSGDVLVATSLQVHAASTMTRTRVLPELLRLFQISGHSSLSRFLNASDLASSMPGLSSDPSDPSVKVGDEARFTQQYAELQTCVALCLEAAEGR